MVASEMSHQRSAVFISHRGTDLALAQRLAKDIKNAGHEVWLDVWEIGVGDSIVSKVNSGLFDSAFLVLCLSEDGVLSPWISREWMSALAQHLNGSGVTILPVRLSGGRPPAILADIYYADAVSDYTQALKEILVHFHKRSGDTRLDFSFHVLLLSWSRICSNSFTLTTESSH